MLLVALMLIFVSVDRLISFVEFELPLPEGRGFLLLYTRKYTHVQIRSLN